MASRMPSSRPGPRRLKSARPGPGQGQTTDRTRPPLHASSSCTNSDEATASFVRRTLCSHQLSSAPIDPRTGRASTPTIHSLLPPLTSSNDIDLQLYAILSVIIREAVQSWYARITPDHDFVDRTIHVIAHCTRGLEQRLRATDLESLVLDDLPALVAEHVVAYRSARDAVESKGRLGASIREVYHALNRHPALSPVPTCERDVARQAENEAVYGQLLVQGILVLLLPPEDLANPCLRVLITEIFSEMILGAAVAGKVCQGWFVWEALLKIISRPAAATTESAVHAQDAAKPQLEAFGLVENRHGSRLTKIQSHSSDGRTSGLLATLFQALGIIVLCFGYLRRIFLAFVEASALPLRTTTGNKRPVQPFVSMAAWSLPLTILGLDARMPWVTGALSLLHTHLLTGPGRLGSANTRLDRLLAHALWSQVLNRASVPDILRTIREAMFPDNGMGAARSTPTADEIANMKLQCAEALVELLPDRARKLYLGRGCSYDDARRQMEDLLDVFGDAYMNKHLVFAILDLAVCRLFPELSEVGVDEMIAERISLPALPTF